MKIVLGSVAHIALVWLYLMRASNDRCPCGALVSRARYGRSLSKDLT